MSLRISNARASEPRATALPDKRVLGVRIDALDRESAVGRIATWARGREPRIVCAACVNNIMEAHDDPGYLAVMEDADLVVPDGRPIVWALRALDVADASQIRGTDLTRALLAEAATEDIPVAFFGGTPEVLDLLTERSQAEWPALRIVYRHSPPFRALTAEEDEQIVREIEASGVRILFVALGCPKQEQWMASHRETIRAVMVGVGAAFDFLAGTKKQAPRFVQRVGLEWLFRFVAEPRRLWRRYVRHNPRYMFLFAAQLLRAHRGATA